MHYTGSIPSVYDRYSPMPAPNLSEFAYLLQLAMCIGRGRPKFHTRFRSGPDGLGFWVWGGGGGGVV